MSKWPYTIILCLAALLKEMPSHAQSTEDSVDIKEMEEVRFSVSKWELKQNEVPNKITKITKQDIILGNPQTSADMLNQTGAVFVQKSQLGGGSPMIRGFATNRVLIVVDGVRMNNAIFRSGNIQNIISVDALSLETAEVIFGPGSLLYGSDAIGGVMDFHSLHPRLSQNNKTLIKANAVVRYASANKEQTYHADINAGRKKWSLLSSITYSQFDDLKMGIHGGHPSYRRPEFVTRINGIDSIIKNKNQRIQRFSGYDQLNLLEKIRFKASKYMDLFYSVGYSGTGTTPRYDRLLVYKNEKPRFAEWNYGPMRWNIHNLRMFYTKKTRLHDELKYTLAYQDYQESRIERERNNLVRKTQVEKVRALTLNADLNKKMGKGTLFYGIDLVHNKVRSMGYTTQIQDQTRTPIAGRYPDNSKWNAASFYSSYKLNPTDPLTLTAGIRYSYNQVEATLDYLGINYPFENINLQKGATTGNLGMVYRPSKNWQLSLNLATGYRMPNIDDMGKTFESTPGFLMTPNPSLLPEYAYNLELGITKNITGLLRVEVNIFYSILDNAITRRPTSLYGSDSIFYNGSYKQLESLQNVAVAKVWGMQASAVLSLAKSLSLVSYANYIKGRETDDQLNTMVPLRHAPPFYGSSSIRFEAKRFIAEASWVYNNTVVHQDMPPSEKNKKEIYATDQQGRPYSPGWYTLNLKGSVRINKKIQATLGWENLTNQLYRSYSSGIVAPGSNLILSLRTNL